MPMDATGAVPVFGLPGSLAGSRAPDVAPPFGVEERGVAGCASGLAGGAGEAEAWRNNLCNGLGKLLGGTL